MSESVERVPEPTMKVAKSMTGHLYTYPVETCAEFLERVSKDYGVPVEVLQLLDPEADELEEAKEAMKEDVTYLLFMDDTQSVLLPWIDNEKLNHHLRMDNPSYVPNEKDKEFFVNAHLDYCARYPHHISLVEENLDRLTERGWDRFFMNESSPPILSRHLDRVKIHFYRHAVSLAANPLAIDLLEQALREEWPIQCMNYFRKKLSANPNAVPLLLHYPHMLDYHGISNNTSPEAISYLEEVVRRSPELIDQLNWNELCANEAALPLIMKYPHKVNRRSLYYNRNPGVIQWYRLHGEPDDNGWKQICNHTHPDFIAYLQENKDQLPPSARNRLSQNEGAIDWLERCPEMIHWTLLCSNPSPRVIPLIEKRLYHPDPSEPTLRLSNELENTVGYSYTKHNVIENCNHTTILHESHKYTVNCGSLSLHPHVLPLLERHPVLIYWNSLSVHPGIYKHASHFSLL